MTGTVAPELQVLSAGAAKGLVEALAPALRAATGTALHGEFGAVGTIRDLLLSGTRCDVVILTESLLAALARDGRVEPDSVHPLGRVRTGIAVRDGDSMPRIADRAELRETLLTARGLFVPDTERSTAGRHCVAVLRELGIGETMAPRLRTFESGAVAMRALAEAREPALLGCTQITEINYTPGVVSAGPLPAEFDLATVYSAAVATGAPLAAIARQFVALFNAPEAEDLRRRGGFER